MKLIILRTNLLEGLGLVERAVGESANLPILKSILIKIHENKIMLTSTNLELAVECFIPGKIIEKGEIAVTASFFASVIRNLNTERVTLEEKNGKLTISTDNYEATIQTQNPKDFPIIPSIDNKNQILVGINNEVFKNTMGSIIIAAQYSDIRPEISGVYLNISGEILTLAATDGFRLAEKKIKISQSETGSDGVSIIIPLKTATEIMKIFNSDSNVNVIIDPNQILFSAENERVISRLIEGTFPDYQAIIPKQFQNEITIDRNEMMNALKLASAFAGRANDVTLRVGDNKKFLEIYSADSALGENLYRIPVKMRGDKVSLVFNWRYLLDGLKICKSKEVIFGINSSDRPIVIKDPGDPGLIYIAMPIKS